MISEYQKRIQNSEIQELNYFIIENENIHNKIKYFKKLIREKYNIDKSYFHICDPDCKQHLGKQCNCPCNPNEFIFFQQQAKKKLF